MAECPCGAGDLPPWLGRREAPGEQLMVRVEPVIGPGRQEASTGALRRSKQRPRATAGRWGRRWDSPAPSQGWASRNITR